MGAVHQYPQYVEQMGCALDFVQYNQAIEPAQHQLGIGKPAKVRLGLEIEAGCLSRRRELPRQRSLATLTRPEQGSYGGTANGDFKLMEVGGAMKHR